MTQGEMSAATGDLLPFTPAPAVRGNPDSLDLWMARFADWVHRVNPVILSNEERCRPGHSVRRHEGERMVKRVTQRGSDGGHGVYRQSRREEKTT